MFFKVGKKYRTKIDYIRSISYKTGGAILKDEIIFCLKLQKDRKYHNCVSVVLITKTGKKIIRYSKDFLEGKSLEEYFEEI